MVQGKRQDCDYENKLKQEKEIKHLLTDKVISL